MTEEEWENNLIDLDQKPYTLAVWAWADNREERGLPLTRGLRLLGAARDRPARVEDGFWWSWDNAGQPTGCSLAKDLFDRLEGGRLVKRTKYGLRLIREGDQQRHYRGFAAALLALAAAYELPVQVVIPEVREG